MPLRSIIGFGAFRCDALVNDTMTGNAGSIRPLVIALALGVLLPGVSPGGDIHRWVDKDGQVHYGDKPPATEAAETVEKVTVKPNVYASTTVEPLAEDFEAPADVVLYSATWCGYCRQAREYFRANGIAFKEFDVERSRKGRRDFMRLGAAGVPVILVGRQRLNGFNRAAFDKLYTGD